VRDDSEKRSCEALETKKVSKAPFVNSHSYDNKILHSIPKPDRSEIERLKSEIRRWATSSGEPSESTMSSSDWASLKSHQAPGSCLISLTAQTRGAITRPTSTLFSWCTSSTSVDIKPHLRFSECQQVFVDEIACLLENGDKYQRARTESERKPGETLHATIWYHCDCDGNADVDVRGADANTLVAKCRPCNTTFKFEGSVRSALQLTSPNVSLRAEAMLITFSGMGVNFLRWRKEKRCVPQQSRKDRASPRRAVSSRGSLEPRDVYRGIGQLEAILEL
jgi:hypothetical protein